MSAIDVRVAGRRDLDGLVATFTAAFERDPLWSWAIPDRNDLAVWWRLLIGGALRYPCTWIAGDFAAASVWIPPGGVELVEEEEQRVEPLLRELVGPRSKDVLELLVSFDKNHPRGTPHYYLSLLATNPDHAGQGLGMALLGENLAAMDAEGVPTYLESSNPANDRRYERVGYGRTGEFTTPGGEYVVAGMWRQVGGSPDPAT